MTVKIWILLTCTWCWTDRPVEDGLIAPPVADDAAHVAREAASDERPPRPSGIPILDEIPGPAGNQDEANRSRPGFRASDDPAYRDLPQAGDRGSAKPDHANLKRIRRTDLSTASGVRASTLPESHDVTDAPTRVAFNFQGAPWPVVLNWLADVSRLNLDWQELPADELNLTTQQSYTPDEARNILNRHLLERGFTLLLDGEVLTVVDARKLDSSAVPRVSPRELATRGSHEFVKVCFPLKSLLADKAVVELQPLLSPYGRLTALKTTNRLEALDTVRNLRDIQAVLEEEQGQDTQDQLVREFEFDHVRAADVERLLRTLLGQSQGESSGPATTVAVERSAVQQFLQEALQTVQMTESRQAHQDSRVHMVVNGQRNSLLVQAPADQMAIIEQAVARLDVPPRSGAGLQDVVNATRVYRLAQLDPEAFVTIVKDVGKLDPLTTIKIDRPHRSIIVSGALVDHVIINELLKRLDGSERRVEIIRLRRLPAEYVAESIEFMMTAGASLGSAGADGSENSSANESPRRGGQSDGFRVTPDRSGNRVMVFANSEELGQINLLLTKLGEGPVRNRQNEAVREFELESQDDAEKIIDSLRRNHPDLLQERPEPDGERVTGEPVSMSQHVSPAARPPFRPRYHATVARTDQARSDTTQVYPSVAAHEFSPRFEAATPVAQRTGQSGLTSPKDASASWRHWLVSWLRPSVDPQLRHKAEEFPVEGSDDRAHSGQSADRIVNERSRDRSGAQSTARGAVRLEATPEGRLIAASTNEQHLDRVEDLIQELIPARRDFKVFQLKHKTTSATKVAEKLRQYFGTSNRTVGGRTETAEVPARQTAAASGWGAHLSRRIPTFIVDDEGQSILVNGASADQLRTAQELIEVYDRPVRVVPTVPRITKVYSLEAAKARNVARSLRELHGLSQPQDSGTAGPAESGNGNAAGNEKDPSDARGGKLSNSDGDDDTTTAETPRSGVADRNSSLGHSEHSLSISVDEYSNTLLVCATRQMHDDLAPIIRDLDLRARPLRTTVQVIKLDSGVNRQELHDKLARILSRGQPMPAAHMQGPPSLPPGAPPMMMPLPWEQFQTPRSAP